MDPKLLAELIKLFLKINRSPSDEQFHNLAFSVGTDPATLESVAYDMLSQLETPQAQIPAQASSTGDEESQSRDQKVLDGEISPNEMSTDELLYNDGAPEGSTGMQGIKDALFNDGIAPEDSGIDIGGGKNAAVSDGPRSTELKAAMRLASRS